MELRTSPNQTVKSRPTRAKGAVRSRKVKYAINGTDPHTHTARYLVRSFPGQSQATYRAMHNALNRYLDPATSINPADAKYHRRHGTMPTPQYLKSAGVFEGLLD